MRNDALLENLNEPQRQAVQHVDGPLLVVAGAGSGKTRVITRRVAWLLNSGVPPYRILALTFTNKAAREMQERVSDLVPGARVWISTFHAACARILRTHGHLLGLERGFSIYDDSDTESVLKEVSKRLNLESKHWPIRRLRDGISKAKNDLRGPEDLPLSSWDDRVIADAYRAYQDRLTESQAVDFDDLLFKAVKLVRDNEEGREAWGGRFSHILIDEYQDTNAAQYALVRALAAGTRNVCATGDPDQGIYGWRGADIRNILEFERDFPDATVVRLEQNYRSTQPILAAADALIQHNVGRVERALWSTREEGPRPEILVLGDERAEAEEIVRRARKLSSGSDPARRLSEMAVFYRTNAQSREIEQACITYGMPYQVFGGTAFYARREIKDLVAYLRLLVNPRDDAAFRRIINVPRRQIGQSTLQKLTHLATQRGCSLLEALPEACDPDSPLKLLARTRKALQGFRALMDDLRKQLSERVADIVEAVIERTNYVSTIDERTELDRLENVRELVNAGASFDELNPDGDLATFLENAALATDLDRFTDGQDRLTLMTLHMAKGLEFGTVFLSGVEEGLLPHIRAAREGRREDIEEERRLAYVGITRAKDQLIITHTCYRRLYGQSQPVARSRFLKEIPADRVHEENLSGIPQRVSGGISAADLWDAPRPAFGSRRPVRQQSFEEDWDVAGAAEEADFYQDTDWDAIAAARETAFRPGDQVRHPMYGQGRIEKVSGHGNKAKFTIRFARYGVKKFPAGAPLEKL